MPTKNFIEGAQTKIGVANTLDKWIAEKRTQLSDGKSILMWKTESARNQTPFHLDYEFPETNGDKTGFDYNMISKHATKAEAEKEMAVQVTARNKQIAEAGKTPEPVSKTPDPVKETPDPAEGTGPIKKTPEPVKKTPEPVKK